MTLTTLKLVYKNMIWNRPKVGLYGLIGVALLTTSNLFLGLLKFGLPTASVISVLALGAWFVILPCVFTLIDLKHNPQRMEKVWVEIHK